jgi:hypothetical protein
MCALFDVAHLQELDDPEVLVQKASVLVGRYLTDVKRTFRHDWRGVGAQDAGWFGSESVQTALARLLVRLAREGRVLDDVSRTIQAIFAGVAELCGVKKYDSPIMDPGVHPEIPSPRAGQSDVYRFLISHRIDAAAGMPARSTP